MGLDMYAYSVPRHQIVREVDLDQDERHGALQIHYWRKHPDLHGWMEALYYRKGGRADSFNCATVLLTEADLDELEASILSTNLPPTFGFFFGETDGSEVNDDLLFIAKARRIMAHGNAIFYDSWW